jgi:hypothetical protein
MYNSIRRNRNIGTAKQGHGQNNKMVIPQPVVVLKSFYERLSTYQKEIRKISGKNYVFVVEDTRKNSKHACSFSDIANIIEQIPAEDLEGLSLIIFRQPKRKEEILSPTWGRFIYSYEFENDYYPAIIIEAIDYSKKFKLHKNLSLESQKELERLISDGHKIIDTGRFYEFEYQIENVRKTQLYRTLLHEVGHYVHYLNIVKHPAKEDEEFEEWEKRNDYYFSLPSVEKERFAHNYAKQKYEELSQKGFFEL